MADDPYKMLGLDRSASQDAVRKAYLKLVKELHPDVNPSPEAEARFKSISAAYDLLGDPDKRAQFDRGEIGADGEPLRPQWARQSGGGRAGGAGFDPFASGGAGNFGDIFSEAFGGGRAGPGGFSDFASYQRRGRDLRYSLEVSFTEAALGTKKRVSLPEGGDLDLSVPAGIESGQVLRLKGKGAPGFGSGPAGDALVEIRVGRHPKFKRSKDDILIEVPISLDEAVLGAKIQVPTLTGRVNLQIPVGTSSGNTLRLRGKGIARPGTATAGDQLVSVKIVMPDVIDGDLRAFFERWRDQHHYDVGR